MFININKIIPPKLLFIIGIEFLLIGKSDKREIN